jgi:hypothetical protein
MGSRFNGRPVMANTALVNSPRYLAKCDVIVRAAQQPNAVHRAMAKLKVVRRWPAV